MKYNFKVLFEYFEARFNQIEGKFDNLQSSFDSLQTTVDGIAKSHADFKTEITVQRHRIDKLEKTVYET